MARCPTIVHPIDEDSPLRAEGSESCAKDEAEFLVLLTGIDDTFSQTVHSRTSYVSSDVVWNARFQRIFDAQDGKEGDRHGRESRRRHRRGLA